MTLFRQLIIGISILFFVLLAGVEAIYLSNARAQLQEQLSSQAQDAATSLSMRLAALGSMQDTVLVETLVNPVFDRGYFEEIRIVSASGEILVRKSLVPGTGDVPAWFVTLFPIRAPGAQSIVSSGWRELGRVVVVSQPHFAYRQLWFTGLQTIAWLLLGYIVAVAAASAFLSMLLRPLREIERAAIAISEKDFITISLMPRARELSRVVTSMNEMSARIKEYIAEEATRAEGYRREAFIDPLSSLFNRRGFDQQLQSLIHSYGDIYSGALVLVEIRGFGEFNAKVGYRRGDEVLALLAKALVAACGSRSVVCGRMGGAAFSVAVVNVEPPALQELVEEICRRIGVAITEQGLDGDLHFDCGATRWEGALPELPALLAVADHAVAQAGGKGANEWAIENFDQAASMGSQAWRAQIEECIADNRIAIFSQEAFGIAGRRPVHAEVTVRLLSATEAPIAAARFLPMAVRHGLVGRLDCRVVEMLLGYLARVPGDSVVAVNIGAQTIADPDATRRLLALLDASAVQARRITFEMTEFGAMQDMDLTRRFSGEVRRRGARFALDTFGLREGSLMLVHALRPQYIKLSAGYSREISGSQDCRFLVTSLVRVAKPLGIDIFAQAVDDESLIPLLAEIGLAGYQGFAVSTPTRIV